MTTCRLSRLRMTLLCGVASLAAGFPTAAAAQAKPFSLTDVLQLVQGKVSTQRILKTIGKSCISFRVTADAANVLRNGGADQTLINDLRSECFAGSADDMVSSETSTRRSTEAEPVVENGLRPMSEEGTAVFSDKRFANFAVPNAGDPLAPNSRNGEPCSSIPGEFGLSLVAPRPPFACNLVASVVAMIPVRIEVETRNVAEEGNASIYFGNANSTFELLLAADSATTRTGAGFSLNGPRHNGLDELIKWTKTPIVRIGPGVTNDVAIEVRNATISIFINNTHVATVHTAPATGQLRSPIGISVGTSTRVEVTHYRAVAIR